MSRIDPSIVLASRPVSAFDAFQEGRQVAEQREASKQNRELREQQIQQARLQRLDEREQRRLRSTAQGALQLNNFLQNNDLQGARNFLLNRKRIIEESKQIDPTLDTNDTDDALRLLNENPQELLNVTDQLIDIGTRTGVIRPAATGEQFTLKAGETRFDPKGGVIAKGQPEQQKAPTGFRFKQDGNLEIIPGGPADIKNKTGEEKKRASKQLADTKANIVLDKVDDALNIINNSRIPTTGAVGQALSNIGGTGAFNLEQTVNTIQANLGFDTLQQMREASPTGGALGAVSERELSLLTSAVASLNTGQSKDQLIENLNRIRTHYNNWNDTVNQESDALTIDFNDLPE